VCRVVVLCKPGCPVHASGFQSAIPVLSAVPPPATAAPGHGDDAAPWHWPTRDPVSQGGGGRECIRWTIRYTNCRSLAYSLWASLSFNSIALHAFDFIFRLVPTAPDDKQAAHGADEDHSIIFWHGQSSAVRGRRLMPALGSAALYNQNGCNELSSRGPDRPHRTIEVWGNQRHADLHLPRSLQP
jgi:hypothetical protein